MKFFIVALLCGLSVQALYAYPADTVNEVKNVDDNVTPSDNQVCVPNEVKMENCNRCKCAPNGVGWFCTRNECPKEVPEKTSTLEEESPVAKTCEPGTTWNDGCNACHCSDTGVSACTKKKCIQLPENLQPAKRETKDCEPGKTWKNDCNTCHCTETGVAACTRLMCPPQNAQPAKREAKECEPGSKWNDGCNDCWCNDEGQKYCTKQACEEIVLTPLENDRKKRSTNEEKPLQECEPGTSFKEDCNSCFCTATGLKACTMMRCYSSDDVKISENEHIKTKRSAEEVKSAKECEPGTTWKEDCNTCFCTEGGFKGCTLIGCIKLDQATVKEVENIKTETSIVNKRDTLRSTNKCTPGQSFLAEDGCNTCRCNADGTPGGCTFKLCPTRHVRSDKNTNNPDKTAFSCSPGEAFKHSDGCNDCVCSNDGKNAACTLKLCVDMPKRDPYADNYHCTPGSTFVSPADGCNTCHCNAEGKTAGCTEIACNENEPHIVSKRSPITLDPASPEFQCTPGTSFTHSDGCNSCTCSDSGKNAACTLMLCITRPDSIEPVVQQPEEPVFTGNPYQPEGFSCRPGASFKYECNDCRCLTNGKLAMCTLKLCPQDPARLTRGVSTVNNNDPTAPNFRCVPGDQFNHADGCNSCICDKDGVNAACTLRQCLPSSPEVGNFNAETVGVVPSQEKKCVPGSRFKSDDGCNTCFCTNEGKVGCTLMYCGNKPAEPGPGGVAPNVSSSNSRPIQFPILKRNERGTDLKDLPHFDTSVDGFTCEPGKRFRDKCNLCRCNAAGKAACTDRLCPEGEA